MLQPFPASVILREPGRARYVKAVVKAGCLDKNRGRADRLEDLFLLLWKRTGDEAYLCLRPNFYCGATQGSGSSPAHNAREQNERCCSRCRKRPPRPCEAPVHKLPNRRMRNYKPEEQQRVTRLQCGGQTHAN